MGEYSRGSLLLRYFLHGIVFSLLWIVLMFAWAVFFVFLVMIGWLIGLVIGIIVLLLFAGGLNIFLSGLIWSLNVKSGWLSILSHGLVLLLLEAIAGIPAIIVELAVPNLATTITVFVVYCFVDGFIARNVASWWKEEFIPEDAAYPPTQTD